MKKSTRILLIIVLCLVLIAICAPDLFVGNHYKYQNAGRYNAGGCEIDRCVKNIDVSWVAGEVNIARHDGDEIILSEESSRRLKSDEQLHWLVDGDTLYVKYVRSGKRYSSRLDKELTLLIPEDMRLDDVQVFGVSAEVEMDLPTAENVRIENVSGEVEATLQKTQTLRVNTVSGDLELCFPTAPENIKVNSVSAEVTIQLPKQAGFTAEMDSVSGRMEGKLLDGDVKGKAYTHGNGECTISVDTVSGNLQLDPYKH